VFELPMVASLSDLEASGVMDEPQDISDLQVAAFSISVPRRKRLQASNNPERQLSGYRMRLLPGAATALPKPRTEISNAFQRI